MRPVNLLFVSLCLCLAHFYGTFAGGKVIWAGLRVEACQRRRDLSVRRESQCSAEWFMGTYTYRVWASVQR